MITKIREVVDFKHYNMDEKSGIKEREIQKLYEGLSFMNDYLAETKKVHQMFRTIKTSVENRWTEELYQSFEADDSMAVVYEWGKEKLH